MKEQFLWGSATASYQCEGGYNLDDKVESMWDKYLHDNNLENADVACDFYHHFKEDIKMLKDGGQNSYRFSLAWPRIISDLEGTVNQKGIDFYLQVFKTLKEHGIEPNVTLYHWDLPQYLEELGGWLNQITCEKFAHYAKVCFDAFTDEVDLWVTFNEPRWFIFNGYFIGNYPPCIKDPQIMIKGAYNVMYASSLAVREFRKGKYKGSIGIVHSYSPVDGVDNEVDTLIAMRHADNYCNNWVLETAAWGEFPGDLLGKLKQSFDISFIDPKQLEIIKEYTVDFLGLNYYARVLVKPYTTGETTLIVNNGGSKNRGSSMTIIKGWFEQVFDTNSKFTEWDTEIYPKGLYDGLVRAYKKFHLPIYISENGLGFYEDVENTDMVNDEYRISFLRDHIKELLRAKKHGVDVRGYYVWSTMDLYSWKNGCEKRYGLVGVNFKTLERKPKASYFWYKENIENNFKELEEELNEEDRISM